MLCARRICAVSKFDTPMYRTLPWLFRRASVRPAFFDVSVGLWPMDLVKVDDIDLQAPQAGLNLTADRLAFSEPPISPCRPTLVRIL